ncbi:hypothetical protein [Conexibacter sp. SYSU D00693]|uniref:hypothetical protein n=1 Tax=Conexibacter sp. SYSU D00693 TaxID=2812560 RepID=UPI00196AA0FF|nr:hypothetical protein [Conexibacter sp. SYSU D00693]
MHLTIHQPLVDDAAAQAIRAGARTHGQPPTGPQRPDPGRWRMAVAHALALAARRVDGETARRAIA